MRQPTSLQSCGGCMHRRFTLILAGFTAACSDSSSTPTTPNQVFLPNTPCGVTGTLSLAVNTTALVDCSNGGTTLTLAGNGASYVVVPQFATNKGLNQPVPYVLASGNLASASLTAGRAAASRMAQASSLAGELVVVPGARPLQWQHQIDRILR